MGLAIESIPLFEIAPLDWSAPDASQFDAILITSANAIRFGGAQLAKLKPLPVYAVGAATAAAAREAGFSIASVGDGGVRHMPSTADRRLLHLAGRDHVDAGAAMTIPVYEARAIDRPAGIEELRQRVVAIHSARAGSRFAELAGHRLSIAIAAISPAAAEACGTGWQGVHIAPQPTDEALLALAAGLCERLGA